MRITNSMMMDNVLKDLNNGMLRMDKYSSQLASNRKMVRLSDNSIGLNNSLNARAQLRQIQQYRDNIVTTRQWTQQAESSITDMQSIVRTVYENTIDAGGVKNPDDKKNIATLINQMKQHLFETCNTAIADKYIFGGFNTSTKPFSMDADGKVLYNGLDLGASTPPRPANAFGIVTDVTFGAWTGDIYPLENYTITANGADELLFTTADGSVTKTVKIPTPQEGTNTINMTSQGLGVITYECTDPLNLPTATDIRDAIAVAGNVSSDLYVMATQIEMETAIQQPASDPAAAITWNGPMTAQGKFTVSTTNNPGEIAIHDERGTLITKQTLVPGAGGIDLTSVGLGTITWNPATVATAEDIADSLSNTGFVTTKLGQEMSQHIRFETGFETSTDATFNGIQLVGLGKENLFRILDDLLTDLNAGENNDVLTTHLTRLLNKQDAFLTNIVELGARATKLDMMENRYQVDFINAEAVRTDIEDIDQAYVIMQYKFCEAIYRQALAAGAQIIQPTLMDFLR